MRKPMEKERAAVVESLVQERTAAEAKAKEWAGKRAEAERECRKNQKRVAEINAQLAEVYSA